MVGIDRLPHGVTRIGVVIVDDDCILGHLHPVHSTAADGDDGGDDCNKEDYSYESIHPPIVIVLVTDGSVAETCNPLI